MTNPVEQLRAGIHHYFKEFGHFSCELIFSELLRHGGLAQLLKQLGLTDPGNSEDQYACLLNYLRKNGMDMFASRLSLARGETKAGTVNESPRNLSSSQVRRASNNLPPLQRNADSSVSRQYNPVKVRATMPRVPTQYEEILREDPKPDPASSAETKEQKSLSPKVWEKSSEIPGPAKPTVKTPANTPKPVKPSVDISQPVARPAGFGTNSDGSWDGVTERRSGKDRRSGRDRRDNCELIFKNRRFGKDRRSGGDRRKRK